MSGPQELPSAGLPAGSRRSHLLGGSGSGSGGVLVSVVSTALFAIVLVLVIVNAPNWPAVQQAFLDPEVFAATFPLILRAFAVNVALFLIAEVFILVVALGVALMRSLPGPVFTPVRGMAIVYTDLFRGVPGVLVIFILGFGIPGLGIEGVPTSEFFWGTVALVLIYSAYVSEVYRAGIESVHPSQDAAARSLGLSRAQALRFVVIPQAIRRVIPPLLNDFIGLQKDTALVAFIGLVEAFSRSQIESSAAFNFTPYVITAGLFLLITVPLARFVDWLVARDRRRQMAGAR